MHILDEITLRLAAHELLYGGRSKATVYAGKAQMVQIRQLFDRMPSYKEIGAAGANKLMGMPLVEVLADDYLRVA